MTSAITVDEAVARARALGPVIFAARKEIERERKLPPALFEQLKAAGMFRLQTPSRLGGFDFDHVAYMRVVEEISRADGATGWTVAIGNSGTLAASFPPARVDRFFEDNPDLVTAGSFNPRGGRALPVAGGHQVSGRWTFVSGSSHADWFQLGCLVFPDGQPPAGPPRIIRVMLPPAEVTILDTWHVGGLRGTASHDVTVGDAFVPEENSYEVSLETFAPVATPMAAFPQMSFLGLGFVSVGLGIARGAIDTLLELAGSKRPVTSRDLLRDRATTQIAVAKAEAMLGSARLYLHEQVARMWARAEAGERSTKAQRAALRGAVVLAGETSARVVDMMYEAGGSTSLYEDCPLERAFRDVHAVTAQVAVASHNWEVVGKVMLGLEVETIML